MINFYNQVPSVYPNASRDFQYLSWLINIVLNSVKHNVDDLYNLPNNKADSKLAELLALTLGFKIKRNYDKAQLTALIGAIPAILKCKGSIKAIEIASRTLVKQSGAPGETKCTLKDGTLEILLPKTLVDTTLFMDLLPYILPAGLTCRIVRETSESDNLITYVGQEDSVLADWYTDAYLDAETREVEGLSTLFDVGSTYSGFVNYNQDNALNIGLMDNSIVPTIDQTLNIKQIPKNTTEESTI